MIAIAARPFALSTFLACGKFPRLAPPLRPETFKPEMMEGAGLLYLILHGLPGQPYLYGGDWSTAMTADQVRQARLGGAIVYAGGCFNAGAISTAFLEAGAACVVGDRDSTWSGLIMPRGTNEFGRLFVDGLRKRWNAGEAFDAARRNILHRHPKSVRYKALADTVALIGKREAKWVAGG